MVFCLPTCLVLTRSPRYEWNPRFRPEHLARNIDNINRNEQFEGHFEDSGFDLDAAKRMSYSGSAETVLDSSQDLLVPVCITTDFAAFANNLVKEALKKAKIPLKGRSPTLKVASRHTGDRDDDDDDDDDEENEMDESDDPVKLHMWRIDSVTMWQQLDRRIDE